MLFLSLSVGVSGFRGSAAGCRVVRKFAHSCEETWSPEPTQAANVTMEMLLAQFDISPKVCGREAHLMLQPAPPRLPPGVLRRFWGRVLGKGSQKGSPVAA